ncbi:MAG: hypothetical protein CM1200mP13_10760 [Candidatus Pelagibacterales bacterium]|nr:MAG: hypothetical protein CM1200mP13_10760 [Pelagibacterales bacterium]
MDESGGDMEATARTFYKGQLLDKMGSCRVAKKVKASL